jgi:hypothetical protein
MRVIAICKVLDEADIIEAFARHTAHYAAHQIFLDNGSIDGTMEILRLLRQEGLSLTILQNGSRWFNEAAYNTHLYHRAVAEHTADWVTFLDVDEFIDDRNASLKSILETAPPPVSCARVMLTNYHPTGTDDQNQPVVPMRIQWVEQRTDVPKVIVRGNLVDRNVIVQDGAHGVLIDDGRTCSYNDVTAVNLAHYPERSPFQTLVKFVRGWSRVLASGTIPPTATHYSSRFEQLRDQPQHLLYGNWINKFQRSPQGMEHDPIIYRGGPLRYTQPQDEMLRAIRAMVGCLEALSREHGRLLDECPGAREMVAQWAASLYGI